MSAHPFLASEAALNDFLAAFRERRLPKVEWTHGAHLAMGAASLLEYSPETVLGRVREDIRTYDESVGGKNTADDGYHESVTVFWLAMLAGRLAAQPPELNRLDRVADAVGALEARRDLYRDYWSFDIIRSREARARWIPPDTRDLHITFVLS